MIIIGNSFVQSPGSNPDMLPCLLSYKLKTSIDWYRINSLGPFDQMIYRILNDPSFFFENKKCLIMHVGTDHMRSINESNRMLNISAIDHDRLVLNNRFLLSSFVVPSNTDASPDKDIWGELAKEGAGFIVFKDSERYNICSKIIDNDTPKSTICIISTVCLGRCSLFVNGQHREIPSLSDKKSYYNLVFELPCGTSELKIDAAGTLGSSFLLKNIQIWQ